MSLIAKVHAREILNSRGYPTVEVDVTLESGVMGQASVPTGASIGTYEAYDLRDGDAGRYRGKGVLKAVDNINKFIDPMLKGMDPLEQVLIDESLIHLDGTLHKTRLGANAVLAVSLAVARAAAHSMNMPLWRYLGGLNANLLPVPFMNVISGGTRLNKNLNIQEFLIIPHGAPFFTESLRMGAETYHALEDVLADKGKMTGVGDEGAFYTDFRDQEEALDSLMEAIKKAGYVPGTDISIGLDIAASHFCSNGAYQFPSSNYKYTSGELIDMYEILCGKYPIMSIEDGLAEDDWHGWKSMTERLGAKIQLIGDDLFVTHKERLRIGIENGAANSACSSANGRRSRKIPAQAPLMNCPSRHIRAGDSFLPVRGSKPRAAQHRLPVASRSSRCRSSAAAIPSVAAAFSSS